MTKIEDRVWALGGRDSNNNTPSKIAGFNPATNHWEEIAQELHSSNTSELAATEFPASAIDCVQLFMYVVVELQKERKGSMVAVR